MLGCSIMFHEKRKFRERLDTWIRCFLLVSVLQQFCRVPKGGVFKGGGGNWGTLRIPREDWGTLGNIRED